MNVTKISILGNHAKDLYAYLVGKFGIPAPEKIIVEDWMKNLGNLKSEDFVIGYNMSSRKNKGAISVSPKNETTLERNEITVSWEDGEINSIVIEDPSINFISLCKLRGYSTEYIIDEKTYEKWPL